MKKILLAATITSIFSLAQATEFKTDDDKISYAIGTQIAQSIQQVRGNVKINEALLMDAIKDILGGKEPKLTPEQLQEVMDVFKQKIMEAQKAEQEKVMAEQEKSGATNKTEGEKFLAENKAKEGVKVTESGLQYRVITEGKGKKPTADDTVSVHYKGTLPDGTEFDSSYARNQPIDFPLSGVIKGWTEGVQLMNEGSKFEFVIPAELAYGPHGPGKIGPNRVLKFEVELLKVVDAKAVPKAAEAPMKQ